MTDHMVLVDYSESEDSESESEGAPKVEGENKSEEAHSLLEPEKKKLPEPPQAIFDKFAIAPKISNKSDPNFYSGMSRALPFKTGFKSSFFFVEWRPTLAQREILHTITSKTINIIDEKIGQMNCKSTSGSIGLLKWIPSYESNLNAHIPLHISLSNTHQFECQTNEAFVRNVNLILKNSPILKSGDKVKFNKKLTIFTNEEKSKLFLALVAVPESQQTLSRLVDIINNQVAIFDDSQPLYTKDKLHSSIMWTHPGVDFTDNDLAKLRDILNQKEFDVIDKLEVPVESVKSVSDRSFVKLNLFQS